MAFGAVGGLEAGFFQVALQGPGNQLVEKFGETKAAFGPKFGVHGDAGKAGHGVEF